MSVEIKKLQVSSIVPVQPPGPSGSYYYSMVIPSTTADGYVNAYDDTSFANVRIKTTGNGASATTSPGLTYGAAAYEDPSKGPRYWIYRNFLYFDMSAVPAGVTVLSGTLRVHTYDYATNVPPNQWADSSVAAFEGTQAASLTTADFDAFTGSEFGHVAWKKYNVNYIELNQVGLDYLTAQIGSEAKICLREYEHDVVGAVPEDNTYYRNGIFFREAETYNFYSSGSAYHREYIPFLKLYYRWDWEDTNPGTTTGQKLTYALDGPTAWKSTDWNHDLRIAYITSQHTTWSGARDATTGVGIAYGDRASMRAAVEYGSNPGPHEVQRAFIAFDTAEITDDVENISLVQLRVRSRNYFSTGGTPRAQVFQGTWDYTLTTADIDSFTGGSLVDGAVTWVGLDSYVYFTLNQTGIDYVKNNIGKLVYFCIREYDHDVLDTPFTNPGDYYACTMYGTGQGADSTYDPQITINYTKAV